MLRYQNQYLYQFPYQFPDQLDTQPVKERVMSIRAISVSVLAIAALAGTASAQFFSNGNLVVTRLGDGIATLGSTAALSCV